MRVAESRCLPGRNLTSGITPRQMRWMADELPNARALDLPDGSHLAMYDDQQRYMDGLIRFLRDVDRGDFE